MRKNETLKAIYNKGYDGNKPYSGGEGSFFTFPTDDITKFLVENIDFKGKRVLEVGCGTGETAYAIASAGAKEVLAIDYSENAIESGKSRHTLPNLIFVNQDYHTVQDTFDIVVLQEVIEHLDNPEQAIVELIELATPQGKLVLTCPNFTNIRGYIWMTLQLLLEVPMSLTDLHFLSPFDFIAIAEKHKLKLDWNTFAHNRVYDQEKLVYDMRKRLTNALRDAELDNSRVEIMLEWLCKALTIDNEPTRFNGGKGFYIFSKE